MKPLNIIIDTDPGDDVDDVLAIAFALLRPELAVRAVTTVSYDTAKRCQIVAKLLSVMGRTDVPFAPGMPLPISPLDAQRKAKLADRSSGYILNQYPFVGAQGGSSSLPDPSEDAIALMARTVRQYEGNIALVAIGPLTNIAVFLRSYPELAPKIKWIALMGGELELNRREHNINWDVCAADCVLSSDVPIFMGTWSVTRQFVLSPEDCQLIKAHPSPLCQALSQCIDLWWPHKAHKPGPVMYDVAPLIWSFDRQYYGTTAQQVKVETAGTSAHGMCTRAWDGPMIEVSTSMLAPQVRQMYLDTILGG